MKKNIYENRVLILDFGSQYTQLIARRIREIGVYCEVWSWNADEESIREFSPNGIILTGGPRSVIEVGSPYAPEYVFEAGVPILGICYGMQTMSHQLGGSVIRDSGDSEFGYAQVELIAESPFFGQIQDEVSDGGRPLLDVWMSHRDKVSAIPEGFVTLAQTKTCQVAAIANEEKCFYGLQFHPEVTHTSQGKLILERFLLTICKCEAHWTTGSIIESTVAQIRTRVGCDKVILGLSGGVDSLVLAKLMHQAIGSQLVCVFVDNGLLRLHEADQVMEMLGDKFGLNIIRVDAEARFLGALEGINAPEIKRKIIGRVFIEIFDEQAKQLKNAKWLAQGTIYPDIIESAVNIKANGAHLIKSHHNVGGLPQEMQMELVEPLKELFKDEVRKIGLDLSLPYDALYRHPFPGPGLGVRILGEVKKEYCDLLRQADEIFVEELRKANLYKKVSQAFVVFLPVRSVGVVGDNRKYDWVVSLRAVETTDFMTAHWSSLPYNILGKVSNRIINEVDGIGRVVYDISGKPPATIEWE